MAEVTSPAPPLNSRAGVDKKWGRGKILRSRILTEVKILLLYSWPSVYSIRLLRYRVFRHLALLAISPQFGWAAETRKPITAQIRPGVSDQLSKRKPIRKLYVLLVPKPYYALREFLGAFTSLYNSTSYIIESAYWGRKAKFTRIETTNVNFIEIYLNVQIILIIKKIK